jgi:dolichyl-diphosphooligosaccharide--protein glycosyltransferase
MFDPGAVFEKKVRISYYNSSMQRLNKPDWLFSTAIILVAMSLALVLRIALPWDSIFSAAGIKLTGVDAYYYMRLVDNLVVNFPYLNVFDPYILYPGGDFITRVPAFFAYILSGAVRLLGGAAADQHTVDSIAVFVPPLLGALSVIPVYFIGRALVNRWAGLIAALIFSIMPGQLLSCTLLGNTDHHCAEIFLSGFFSMFFILAIQHGRQFTYTLLLKGRFPPVSKHIPYSMLAGLFFGLYLITWQGAPIILFIIFIYFILQFISDHLRGLPTDYLSKIAITCFLVALMIMLPFSRDRLTFISLAAVILCPVALNIISNVMAYLKIKRMWFLVLVASLGLLGGLPAWLVIPEAFNSIAGYIVTIFSWRMEQTVVGEMKPLFFPGGFFTLDMAWHELGLVLYSGMAGLALLGYRAVRKGLPEQIYFAVLSLVMLLASFSMIRFIAYSAVMLAVLTGYLAGHVISALTTDNQHMPLISKKNRKAAVKPAQISPAQKAWLIVTVLAIIAIMAPTAISAVNVARRPAHTPPDAWMQALDWLKQNSPEPFGDARTYYNIYSVPKPGESYAYPATMYSVAVWIDYGYWITRIAHRVPANNPARWLTDICSYYTAQEEAAADSQMAAWKARYVVVDNRVASPNDKFYAVANLINKKETDFYELCWQKKEGKYMPLLVFYPDYYRCMLIRLYNFDGRQVIPRSTLVMSYTEQQMPDGQRFKEITALKSFNNYTEAAAYISGQKQGNYSIIGTDPLASPVPLEALKGYSLAYQSAQKANAGGTVPMPEVKIFAYTASANE